VSSFLVLCARDNVRPSVLLHVYCVPPLPPPPLPPGEYAVFSVQYVLPRLPPRLSIFEDLSASFMVQRRAALQLYLDRLAECSPEVLHSDELSRFFSPTGVCSAAKSTTISRLARRASSALSISSPGIDSSPPLPVTTTAPKARSARMSLFF
jgi:hypothetical protein